MYTLTKMFISLTITTNERASRSFPTTRIKYGVALQWHKLTQPALLLLHQAMLLLATTLTNIPFNEMLLPLALRSFPRTRIKSTVGLT
jgi:hypothetical protein